MHNEKLTCLFKCAKNDNCNLKQMYKILKNGKLLIFTQLVLINKSRKINLYNKVIYYIVIFYYLFIYWFDHLVNSIYGGTLMAD